MCNLFQSRTIRTAAVNWLRVLPVRNQPLLPVRPNSVACPPMSQAASVPSSVATVIIAAEKSAVLVTAAMSARPQQILTAIRSNHVRNNATHAATAFKMSIIYDAKLGVPTATEWLQTSSIATTTKIWNRDGKPLALWEVLLPAARIGSTNIPFLPLALVTSILKIRPMLLVRTNPKKLVTMHSSSSPCVLWFSPSVVTATSCAFTLRNLVPWVPRTQLLLLLMVKLQKNKSLNRKRVCKISLLLQKISLLEKATTFLILLELTDWQLNRFLLLKKNFPLLVLFSFCHKKKKVFTQEKNPFIKNTPPIFFLSFFFLTLENCVSKKESSKFFFKKSSPNGDVTKPFLFILWRIGITRLRCFWNKCRFRSKTLFCPFFYLFFP